MPQRPEAFRYLLLGILGVDAGEIYVLSTQRRNVLYRFVGNIPAPLAQVGRGPAEVDDVSMHDRADHEVESGSPECLAVKGVVADFASLMGKDGPLELVSTFTYVRVSATWQTTENQIQEIEAAGFQVEPRRIVTERFPEALPLRSVVSFPGSWINWRAVTSS